MKKGCVIFAHNGDIDYGSQSVLAACLVNRYLNVPISLISDYDTINDIKTKFSKLPFDQIIKVEKPNSTNKRTLTSDNNKKETVSFINSNRSSVWDLTPYERTLVIDSDFLIFSSDLAKYWDDDHEFLIAPGMNDFLQRDISPTEYEISQYSIKMLWATTMMFTKSETTKILFDLVGYIREEYQYFANLYEFDHTSFRNDYAFSIACHIMSAHGLDKWHGDLPVPTMINDTDEIIDIKSNGQLTLLCKDFFKSDTYLLLKSQGQDLHIINKKTILDNLEKLLGLADE